MQGMPKIQLQSVGWEDPLEKEMVTHPNILPGKFPWTEEPDGLWSTGLQRVRCHWVSEHTHRQCNWLSLHSQISSLNIIQLSSVQSLSCVWISVTSWTAARQASLSLTNSWSLLKLMSTVSVIPSNHLILCCPLLLLPSIFPSIRVFSNESVLCIRWPKYWSFSFSISSSNEYLRFISFRRDRLDLLAVQGILKSLLQYHSSKASILWRSAFFRVQLSHTYTNTWKTRALTWWTFVGKVMSLL